jgi:hypothetical protein
MRFQREEYSENLVVEMRPLLKEHDREIPQLGLAHDPDWNIYKTMNKAKALRIYTARVADLLVGYQVFMIGYHPHRRASLEATQDILFLEPEVRHGMVGLKFIKYCDKELEKENVRVIHHPFDVAHDLGRLFERLGYMCTDIIYSRKVA